MKTALFGKALCEDYLGQNAPLSYIRVKLKGLRAEYGPVTSFSGASFNLTLILCSLLLLLGHSWLESPVYLRKGAS